MCCLCPTLGSGGVMSILISMVQAGDIATNLLDKARRAAGLNQTQAQICLHLSGLLPAGHLAPRALSPLEMSKALKSPGARVHNQLRLLLVDKRVSHAPAIDLNGTRVDQRQRKYM